LKVEVGDVGGKGLDDGAVDANTVLQYVRGVHDEARRSIIFELGGLRCDNESA